MIGYPCTRCSTVFEDVFELMKHINICVGGMKVENTDDKCELCGGYRSSLTTRSVLGHKFCVECGDNIVLPRAQVMFGVLMETIRDERRATLAGVK